MKKKRSLTALLLSLSLVLGACAPANGGTDKEDTAGTGAEQEETVDESPAYQAKLDVIDPAAYGNAQGLSLEKGSYISIIGKSDGGQYWDAVKEGAMQAAEDINKELGYEGDDEIKVTYSGPAKSDDVDEQVSILDEELDRYPVALGISIADMQACEVQFDLAAESDIPVVAFDSGSDYQGLMATVSTDNAEAAAYAAGQMGELLEGKGQIAVFAPDSKSQSALTRVNSFVKQLEKDYPEIQVVSTYYSDQMEEMQEAVAEEIKAGTYRRGEEAEDPQEVTAEEITEEDIMDYLFAKYPDLKGCYGVSGEGADPGDPGPAEERGCGSDGLRRRGRRGGCHGGRQGGRPCGAESLRHGVRGSDRGGPGGF